MQKKLVDKLVEEYSRNIDGNEMIYNDYGKACNSCTNIQYKWKISNNLTLKTEHITF